MNCRIAYWIVTCYLWVCAPVYVVADHDAALLEEEHDSSPSRALSTMFTCPDDKHRELGSRKGRRHEKKHEYKYHKSLKTIGELVKRSGFNILVKTLPSTDLLHTVLDPSVDFTFFAPTDMAFKKLGAEKLKELFDTPAILKEVLLNHVVGCSVTSRDLAALMSPITVPTLFENSSLEVIVRGRRRLFVKGDGNKGKNVPRVINADVMASNGVIHVIDEVILPAPVLPTITELAQSTKRLRTLVDALKRTGQVTATTDPNSELTVFAPIEKAFEKLGKDNLDYLFNNPEILKMILLYHIAKGTITSEMLIKMDSVETLLDQSFGVTQNKNKILLKGIANTKRSKIKKADLEASNGVVHRIHQVLVPILPIGATAALNGFSLLTKALEETGLSDVLNDVNEPFKLYTVFAPTDAAFNALGQKKLNNIFADTEVLKKILLSHVVVDVKLDRMALLKDVPVSFTSLSDSKINLYQDKRKGVDALLIKCPSNHYPAKVVTDIDAINGIIHVIEKVLLPHYY